MPSWSCRRPSVETRSPHPYARRHARELSVRGRAARPLSRRLRAVAVLVLGVTDAPFLPGVKSYMPIRRPVKSLLFWMPESMTATVMFDPVNESCRPSACLSVLTVL